MSAEPIRRVLAYIPARHDSSRFPGKPLVPIGGVAMIARVIARARSASRIDEVCVATDDDRIAQAAADAGASVAMTGRHHVSGTDRIVEALGLRDDLGPGDIVLNVQGDEPLVDPAGLDALVESLADDAAAGAATLAFPLDSEPDWLRPDVVKVVRAADGSALLFSRAPVPFDRDRPGRLPAGAWKHLGVYAFRLEALLRFAGWGPSPLERLERLEQLRLLENGIRIRVVQAAADAAAVDRPEDVARVEELLARIGDPYAARAGGAASGRTS